MSVAILKWHFDHLSVVSKTNAPALAALAKLLGLPDGYRPPFTFSGSWLYQGDDPLLHVIHNPDSETLELNHIAFRSEMPLPVLYSRSRIWRCLISWRMYRSRGLPRSLSVSPTLCCSSWMCRMDTPSKPRI